MSKRFHLAWFTNFTVGNWDGTFSHGGSPWDGRFFVDMALALERACFDYVIYEDKLLVPEAFRGSTETTLKYTHQVPKHDPVPLAAMVAAATSHLGVVPTMSTLAWPPFMLARVSSTIDHIAGGRFGWNIVTSGEDLAAQNFGMDVLPPRDMRYAMADEYMDLINQLFDSWEDDAVGPCHGNANEHALRACNSARVMPLRQQLATRRQLRFGRSAVWIAI
jgi:long-chain alkane monooxygenase